MFFGVSQERVLETQKWKKVFSGVILTFYSYPKVRIKVRVRIENNVVWSVRKTTVVGATFRTCKFRQYSDVTYTKTAMLQCITVLCSLALSPWLFHKWTTRKRRHAISMVEMWRPVLKGAVSPWLIEVDMDAKLTFQQMVALQDAGVSCFAGEQYINRWAQPFEGKRSMVFSMRTDALAERWLRRATWVELQSLTGVRIIAARPCVLRNILFGTWERTFETLRYLWDGFGFMF
jgi:hypothetical protein